MKLRISYLLLFLSPLISAGQVEDDKVKLQSALDWLDSKLNYIYYDSKGEQWWTNTFYANGEGEITIKHIVSKRPNTANIKNKTYTVRRFQIEDINPRSLKINQIEESSGRIVKGQMLELRTYGFSESIHKVINNRRASSTSFLFLSFPENLIDSLSNYAEVVKQKLEEAISASTQLYSTNSEDDIATVLSVLEGKFQSEVGHWTSERVFSNTLKLDRGNQTIEYFGYDPNEKHFYLLTLSQQGLKKQVFRLNSDQQIKLIDPETEQSILIETPNSFNLNGQVYFRQ